MARTIPFELLPTADLLVDAVYEGGPARSVASDPLHPLLRCGNLGGFRIVGSRRRESGYKLAVLYSSGADPDWPDQFIPETGLFTYFGDNKLPGGALHDTRRGGNDFLRFAYSAIHAAPALRDHIPPVFVFTKGARGRDVVFRGLAAPGAHDVSPSQDLVAVWRTSGGQRFQNYRATFTILDAPVVSRLWITRLLEGGRSLEGAPEAWRTWVSQGRYIPLLAPRARGYRNEVEQMPSTAEGRDLVRRVWSHFSPDPYAFEAFAARLWMMHVGAGAATYTLTRPVVDGGRDAFGYFMVGPTADPISLEYALEAKCYEPGVTNVGVRDLARLISRLRHRQFGVLVTTSVVSRQAYEELRNDGHPVVILSARDLCEILSAHGHGSSESLGTWLDREFPATRPSARSAEKTRAAAR